MRWSWPWEKEARSSDYQTTRDPSYEDFLTTNWQKLSHEERISSLQYLENEMAKEQGRDARTVVSRSDMAPEELGYYTSSTQDKVNTDKIQINRNIVDSNEPGMQYHAMETIIHEGRHAYQDDCTIGKATSRSNEDVDSWRKNYDTYYEAPKTNYEPTPAEQSGQQVRMAKYRFQPIEDDANKYANSKMLSFEAQFQSDPNYRIYVNESLTYIKLDEREAFKVYKNDDFRQEIKADIHDEYDWKNRTRPSLSEQNAAVFALDDYASKKYGESWQDNWKEYAAKDPEFRQLFTTGYPDTRPPRAEFHVNAVNTDARQKPEIVSPFPQTENGVKPETRSTSSSFYINGEKPAQHNPVSSSPQVICGHKPDQKPGAESLRTFSEKGAKPAGQGVQVQSGMSENGTKPDTLNKSDYSELGHSSNSVGGTKPSDKPTYDKSAFSVEPQSQKIGSSSKWDNGM